MIYQLKISLKNCSPPVWRRVLVQANDTFHDLHQVIQTVMDWTDSHLHSFEFKQAPAGKESERKPNMFSALFHEDMFSSQKVTIGSPESDLGLFESFDEYEEKLSDWLQKEKDKCTYTYDFGADWKHDILLEKILQPIPGESYPQCIKVRGASFEEDGESFWDVAEDDNELHPSRQEFDEKQEMLDINMELSKLSTGFSDELEEEMQHLTVQQPSVEEWHRLFLLLEEFKQLKSWEWLSDADIFAIQDPESGEIGYCSILGHGGEEFGLALYLGAEGLRALHLTQSQLLADPMEIIHIQRSLLISFCDRQELEKEDYELIKSLGLSFRGKKQWPLLRSMIPGYYPWSLDQKEVRFLTNVLPQIIAVCQRAQQNPQRIRSMDFPHIFARLPVSTQAGVEWQDSKLSILEAIDEPKLHLNLQIDELYLKRLQKELQATEEVFEFSFISGPQPIQARPDHRPFFPIICLWLEQSSQQIIHHELIQPEELGDIAYMFLHLVERLGWKPQTVLVDRSEAQTILAPLAKQLGSTLDYVEALPTLEDAKQELFGFFE